MEPFAYPDDIEKVWRPLTDEETTLASGLIDQASSKLRALIPNIDSLIYTDELRQVLARAAVVNAVKRVLMNPEALRQISHTTGPYTDSKTLDTAISSGLVYIDSGDLVGLTVRRSAIRSFRVNSGLS